MQRFAFLSLACLLTTTACGDDNSDTATTDNATSSNSTTEGADSTSATTDPATTDAPTTDAATTDPATTDAPTSDGPTAGNAGPCEPEGDDDECAMCVKGMCCDELEACESDPTGQCQCFQACVEMNPGPAGASACQKECETEGSKTVPALINCSATTCADPCL